MANFACENPFNNKATTMRLVALDMAERKSRKQLSRNPTCLVVWIHNLCYVTLNLICKVPTGILHASTGFLSGFEK